MFAVVDHRRVELGLCDAVLAEDGLCVGVAQFLGGFLPLGHALCQMEVDQHSGHTALGEHSLGLGRLAGECQQKGTKPPQDMHTSFHPDMRLW